MAGQDGVLEAAGRVLQYCTGPGLKVRQHEPCTVVSRC